MLSQDHINHLRHCAHAADDLATHRKELDYVYLLQAQLDRITGRMVQLPIHFPVDKQPFFSNSIKASSVNEALDIMERFFA